MKYTSGIYRQNYYQQSSGIHILTVRSMDPQVFRVDQSFWAVLSGASNLVFNESRLFSFLDPSTAYNRKYISHDIFVKNKNFLTSNTRIISNLK